MYGCMGADYATVDVDYATVDQHTAWQHRSTYRMATCPQLCAPYPPVHCALASARTLPWASLTISIIVCTMQSITITTTTTTITITITIALYLEDAVHHEEVVPSRSSLRGKHGGKEGRPLEVKVLVQAILEPGGKGQVAHDRSGQVRQRCRAWGRGLG